MVSLNWIKTDKLYRHSHESSCCIIMNSPIKKVANELCISFSRDWPEWLAIWIIFALSSVKWVNHIWGTGEKIAPFIVQGKLLYTKWNNPPSSSSNTIFLKSHGHNLVSRAMTQFVSLTLKKYQIRSKCINAHSLPLAIALRVTLKIKQDDMQFGKV